LTEVFGQDFDLYVIKMEASLGFSMGKLGCPLDLLNKALFHMHAKSEIDVHATLTCTTQSVSKFHIYVIN